VVVTLTFDLPISVWKSESETNSPFFKFCGLNYSKQFGETSKMSQNVPKYHKNGVGFEPGLLLLPLVDILGVGKFIGFKLRNELDFYEFSKGQKSPKVTPTFDLWFGGHLKLIEGGETSLAIPGFLFYED